MQVRRVVPVALALFVTSPYPAGADPPVSLAAVAARRLPSGATGLALAPVRELANERLGSPACRTLFEDLSDFTGRPVARRLEEGDRSVSSHFARLLFVESEDGPCESESVAAWSVAGDPRVRLCGRTFTTTVRRDRGEAAAILIHEALHTLGVAEDAAPEPLTTYVRRRCGL